MFIRISELEKNTDIIGWRRSMCTEYLSSHLGPSLVLTCNKWTTHEEDKKLNAKCTGLMARV